MESELFALFKKMNGHALIKFLDLCKNKLLNKN